MSGMDGISSLQKMLGGLQVGETANVSGAAAAKPGSSTAGAARSGNLDSASLSAAGGLASDMSDVRMTKVAELRQAIASGSYNVPASAVADKMVESMLG